MNERPIYKKHNSFVVLRDNHVAAKEAVLGRLAVLRKKKETWPALPSSHTEILERALADLFDGPADAMAPAFALSPSVIDEMASFDDDSVLPRYLVHRYRYEMFPQLHVVDDYPPYLQIEPSSVCNYRCVFCFESDDSFTRKSNGFMGHMTFDLFKHTIDQIEGHIEFLSLASRGEPLLCPDIEPMLEYTAGKFLNLKVNTNASLLDERKCHALLARGVKTLVFSADAASEPQYGKLRINGRLDKVVANIELFQRIRQTQYPESRIITRVSGVKIADDQNIESMEAFWGGLVDQVAFVAYNPWENTYSQPLSSVSTPCSDLWRRMFVWWDGKANPCDVDYKSSLCVGDVSKNSVADLWKSQRYQELRERHMAKARREIDPCGRCTVT